MPITAVDKIENIIQTTEDGKYKGRTARMADTVVSVAPTGFKKVSNIYIEPDSGKLIVIYEA